MSTIHPTLVHSPEHGLQTLVRQPIPNCAFVLCLVYLDVGLPPEAALSAALADYECGFLPDEVDAYEFQNHSRFAGTHVTRISGSLL
jgi:hypothetical protein